MAPSLSLLPLAVLLILCAMVLHPAAARGGDPLMLDRFHRWMSAHGRSYPNADEKLRRLEVYRRNVELIDATNRESGHLGYELGENEFTDLTNEEFVARYTGALVPKEDADAIITTLAGDVNEGRRASMVHLNGSSLAAAPANFDWRDQGVVTPAKSQGICGACWAFATVATVESLNIINGGKALDLSEQEVLDCDVEDQIGCTGGYISKALRWIQAKGGVVKEDVYPYQEEMGQCKTTGARRYGKITGLQRVRGEPQLQLAVLQRPVAVLIDAHGSVFQNYRAGIYKGPCTTRRNHAVVLIGYGVTKNSGKKYWILKNSWGNWWGQNGFFFMRRGEDGAAGLCGLAGWSYYPTM